MVTKSTLALAAALGCLLAGCKDPAEANTQRAAPLTVEEQVAKIQARTDMPENIKEQTIANLRQQETTQQNLPKK